VERTRHLLNRKCNNCGDSGQLKVDVDAECVREGCEHWKTIWAGGNRCWKWCPACTGNANIRNQAILKERVYYNKEDPNGYYEEGTECTIKAIDNKWFNLAPQATIMIDGRKLKVKTTKLLSPREYARSVNEGWYDAPLDAPVSRQPNVNNVPQPAARLQRQRSNHTASRHSVSPQPNFNNVPQPAARLQRQRSNHTASHDSQRTIRTPGSLSRGNSSRSSRSGSSQRSHMPSPHSRGSSRSGSHQPNYNGTPFGASESGWPTPLSYTPSHHSQESSRSGTRPPRFSRRNSRSTEGLPARRRSRQVLPARPPTLPVVSPRPESPHVSNPPADDLDNMLANILKSNREFEARMDLMDEPTGSNDSIGSLFSTL